jgi:F-type H+-transporting ATPase subunit b
MTTGFIRAAGAVAAVLLVPAAVLANAPAGEKSVLEPDLVNSAVTVVVFGALLGLLYTFAWGPIIKGLKAREDAQFQAIADAKKAKEEAAALRAQTQNEMAKTAEQVREVMERARKDAEKLIAEAVEAAKKEAQDILARARKDAEADRAAMTKEVQQQTVELAVLIATKAMRQQTTIENQHRLLDESIAELSARDTGASAA